MDLVLEQRSYDDVAVRHLVAEVQREYVHLYGAPDEAAVDPAEFVAPGGLFLVGLLDDAPVATGGWRRRGPDEAEIKRMYVGAPFRGRGLSRVVLAELERTASAAGISVLTLNTGSRQPAAIALYEGSGYRPCPPFGHYAAWPDALFYAKSLR